MAKENRTKVGDKLAHQLLDEVNSSSIGPTCNYININGDDLEFDFSAELSGSEDTELTGIVENHDPSDDYTTADIMMVAIDEVSTTSNTWSTIPGDPDSMSVTPPSGKYLVDFTCSARFSKTGSNYGRVGISKASDTPIDNTIRRLGGAQGTQGKNQISGVYSKTILEVNGQEEVKVLFSRSASTGTLTVYERCLLLTSSK